MIVTGVETPTALEDQRAFLLGSLRDLEAERAAGDIDEADYLALKDDYTARAAAVLRALDGAVGRASPVGSSATGPRRSRPLRTLSWVVSVLLFAALAGVLVARAAGDRLPGDQVSGSIDQAGTDQLARARALMGQQKLLEAVKLYDTILKTDPKNPEALAYRGWIVRLAGLPDKGLEYINRAVAADPSYPDAHFFRGVILFRDKGQPAEGVKEFRLFLANRPPQEMVPLVESALKEAMAAADGASSSKTTSSSAPSSSSP